MSDRPPDSSPRRGLRAVADWFRRPPTPSAPSGSSDATRAVPAAGTPQRIGHYAITGELGRGGMGVVYAARDERLDRIVAIKMMSSVGRDETAKQRFWREARAAASVSHPNVCQLFEIGEAADGELFIAMELLEGEPLSTRLQRGSIPVTEMIPIALGMLSALGALHARGVVHRDLKPSNVFLTPHGVKLLDFGLALPAAGETPGGMPGSLTRTGILMGTPRYMSPEQVNGETLDGRSDLFAAAAIFFEMLAGRPAFGGSNVIEILHATLHEQPPALTGSPAVAAVDRVLRRALAKRRDERPASAEAIAYELRAVAADASAATPAIAQTLTRVVVLPFRVLRPDPETDFLAYSLPDAIATSLARFGSLVVRSTATAARFAGDAPDLRAVAAEADVDRVVMGTLLRSGDQLQATAQLVETPGGTLITSQSTLAPLGDLFQLQDEITRRVVDALALPLGGAPNTPTPRAPVHPQAYELYLRANELARRYDQMPAARDLYRRCVDLDPRFAPAWAQLGRCHRVIGKFFDDTDDNLLLASQALRRALEIDPRLSLAHKFYAQHEADTGQSISALKRLLEEAGRHGNDPEIFAGLVHSLRYCGLFEESLAAHEEARRLDPHIVTSADQTLQLTCDFDRLLGITRPLSLGGGDEIIRIVGMGFLGYYKEARQLIEKVRETIRVPAFGVWSAYLVAWLERNPAEMKRQRAQLQGLRIMDDPEAMFQEAWMFSDVGEVDHGLEMISRAVAKGYFIVPTLQRAKQFDPLRERPEFRRVLAEAEAGRDRALAVFRECGGERLIGRVARTDVAAA